MRVYANHDGTTYSFDNHVKGASLYIVKNIMLVVVHRVLCVWSRIWHYARGRAYIIVRGYMWCVSGQLWRLEYVMREWSIMTIAQLQWVRSRMARRVLSELQSYWYNLSIASKTNEENMEVAIGDLVELMDRKLWGGII